MSSRLRSTSEAVTLAAVIAAFACGTTSAAAQAAQPSWAASPAPMGRGVEPNLLILDVHLGDFVLSDSLTAYVDDRQILLPLGELARLLTLAIDVQPQSGTASGYVIRENRPFALNVEQSLAKAGGRETNFEARRAKVIGDDIYVSSMLLSRWLGIAFDVDLTRLQLRVTPTEKLPLQARLERERAAKLLAGARPAVSDPGYPRVIAPYGLLDRPFIDQTFGGDARFGRDSRQYNAASTTYVTADMLGMEGALYASSTRDKPSPDWRLTLGRNDPDAGLLGPLRARSFLVGNIQVPSVANVMTTSPIGNGVMITNRPLDLPTSFDRQSLRGDLPPGWDVTLYYNDALIGFQQARPDGLYAFDDLPLSFGRNDFVLVFNGPLGQMRSERKSFLLDQSIVKPGELLYSLAQHYASNGDVRSVGMMDVGLTRQIAGSVGFVRMPRPVPDGVGSDERTYSRLGLRGYWQSFIVTSELTLAQHGAALGEVGLKTKLGNYAVDLLHTQLRGAFDSDAFSGSEGGVRRRDKLRVLGALTIAGWPAMPIALDAQRDVLRSGTANNLVSGRASAMIAGTAVTNGLAWQRTGGATTTSGNLQLSRRVADMGLSGQVGYSLKPEARFDTLSLTADRSLVNGMRLSGAVLRSFGSRTTLVSGALSKKFGAFALAVSASYSTQHEIAVGMQLFLALGRDPRTGKWFADPISLAGTGAISARAFVDRNLNGVRDADEEFVPRAGFIINGGGRHPVRTADDGTAFIGRLTPGRYADVALDTTTLEDPQWKPLSPGVRVLPRPGVVQMIEFPVASTSDIDGTVYLIDKNSRRGIGDALVELVDSKGNVAASTTSSSDGFYTLHQVLPGRYALRISPEQAAKLNLHVSAPRPLEVTAEADFISGQDLEVTLSGH